MDVIFKTREPNIYGEYNYRGYNPIYKIITEEKHIILWRNKKGNDLVYIPKKTYELLRVDKK